MAQAGYTPIQLYYSTTAAAVPLAANLAAGELAINIVDGKLYYENNSGVVTLLASAAGASGDVVGPASATDNAVARFDGTTGKLIQNGVVIVGDTGAVTGVTDLTASGAVTLSGGTANGVTYLNGSKVVTSGSALTFDGTGFQLSTSTGGNFYLNSTTTGTSNQIVSLLNNGNGYGNLNYKAFDHIWSYGATEQMRLTSTGLGIGTSSPTAKLDVNGITQSRGNIYGGTSNANANIIAYANVATGGAGTSQFLFGNTSSETRGYLSYNHANDNLLIGTAGATKATLDSSGNLGLGVTPSAWSDGKVLEINSLGNALWGESNFTVLTQNTYYNAGYKYARTGVAAAHYDLQGGIHAWYNAASGTAGNAITFTQAMTLGSNGDLLLGTTTNRLGEKLHVLGNGIVTSSAENTNMGLFGTFGSSNLIIGAFSNLPVEFRQNNTERMRIDSSGNLLVGTTSQLSGGSFGNHQIQASVGDGGRAALLVYNSNALDNAPALNAIKNSATTTSSQRFIQFYADAGSTAMGGIVGNGASNVQFAAISDVREKTNIQPMSGSLAKISALNPVAFDWIKSGEHSSSGFIAQDVEQVFPEFVIENMSNEGEEVRKGLTGGMTSGIIPHLVKAIQEQQAIIKSLKARLDAANL